jgi:N-acetylmuramoyl-L-alanine amidase
VDFIGKRIFILLLAFVLSAYCLLPMQALAATADSKAGVVSISAGYLNVRRSASTSSGVLATLKNGSYITLISKNGNWWYVEFAQGRYGYCHSNYIKSVDSTTATVATNSNPLNVRSGAGTSYKSVYKLDKNDPVTILQQVRVGEMDWGQLEDGNWISLSYVKFVDDVQTEEPKIMTSSQAFVDILKEREGFESTPYWDVSHYSIGYGTSVPDSKVDYYKKKSHHRGRGRGDDA